jgi:succinate semialdehyde reductase
MFTINQPSTIIFGKYSAQDYKIPNDSLVVTSSGAKSRNWLEYVGLTDSYIYDNVESNPSIETTEQIISEFSDSNFSNVIGIGGGSVLDVAKFVAYKMKKIKIMVPTTFGSGSEVTRIAVLKVNGKKQSFHDDNIFADIAIVDPYFIHNTPEVIIKNSAIDACAQCTEGYDSKTSNSYTKFLCQKAFDILENAILNEKYEDLAYGSLCAGLGFGNTSTTLGHALSYVFSNEGVSHGHALAFTTTVAHRFNDSVFYNRYKNLVRKLNFEEINLKQNLEDAANFILLDRRHLDNNPKEISKPEIIKLLRIIRDGKSFVDSS